MQNGMAGVDVGRFLFCFVIITLNLFFQLKGNGDMGWKGVKHRQ